MIKRDYKWVSTGRVLDSSDRRRREARNKVISQVVAVAAGLNAATYALFLLIPNGMWLALILLVAGTSLTTAVMKDIFNE